MSRWLLASLAVVAMACNAGPAKPRSIALGQDACASCRMAIGSMDTAAQVAAPGEESQFFDEIGCLRDYLRAHTMPPDAVVYVADHRTHTWVEARAAVFTRTSMTTPMASGLIAHADVASRDVDPAARDGSPVAVESVLGAHQGSSVP